ncbi:MAG: hypothetical protein IJW21_03430 [Clostridia bacterium]|nr:hypothetical protein [Clostridia bacterium]
MLEFIKERYKDFEVISPDNPHFDECVEITNPYGKGNITLYYHPDNNWVDFTVKWSKYHNHIDSMEDVIKEIDGIINETEVDMEFYRNGEPCIGTGIKTYLLENLTLGTLSRELGTYEGILNTEFTVCSFSGKYDMHGRIERVNGKYTLIIEKN